MYLYREKAGGESVISPPVIYDPSGSESKERMQPSKFAMMLLGHLAYDGFGLLLPVLLPIIARDLGFSLFQLGIISGAILISSALGLLLMGSFSDRVRNRNYLLGGGLIILSMGTFLAGSADSFYMLVALASVIGFSDGVYHPVGLSILTEWTKTENRGKVLGIHGACGTVGMMIFPFAAGLITEAYSWRIALESLAIFGFLVGFMFLIVAGRSEPAKPAKIALGGIRASGILSANLILVLTICALCSMAMSGMSTFLPVKLELAGLSPAEAGTLLSIFFGIGIVTQSVTGVIIDRFRLKTVVAVYLVMVSVFIALLAVAPSSVIVYILVLAGFFSASFYLLNSMQFIEAMPHKTNGTSMGIYYFSGGIASAISPVMIGYVIEQSDINVAFLLIPVFYLSALALLLKQK
jgi:Sugar phosphate permease